MTRWFTERFLFQWEKKVVAFLTAVIMYLLVNSSITTTRTIPDVAVRLINLPQDKTVEDLLPSGILSRRITLTIAGTKSVLDDLEPDDLEVRIDASNKGDRWVPQIRKKNLTALSPDTDLITHVREVTHSELAIKLSRRLTVKVPVTIAPPFGEPPKGYQFLDVWPQTLYHTISGPEELVEELQAKGLELTFDLSQITRQELDNLDSGLGDITSDEVRYLIPSKWKRVAIPFHNNAVEEVNDPRTSTLRIDFLRKESLPLEVSLPVRVYFPPEYSDTLNPANYSLAENRMVEIKNGIPRLTIPLFGRNISRQFMDTVRNHIEFTIVAAPKEDDAELSWGVQFIAPKDLETDYVASFLHKGHDADARHRRGDAQEKYLYNRFRDYVNSFELVTEQDQKLDVKISYRGSHVVVSEK